MDTNEHELIMGNEVFEIVGCGMKACRPMTFVSIGV
jgi:hypothetical protein